MSVSFNGFTGPCYQSDNRYASVERTVNWFVIPNESKEETKWQNELAPCPGNAAFGTLPVVAPFNQPCRGMLENREVLYGVNGDTVFSMDAAGAYTNIGSVLTDANPVSMIANGNGQIFIASAGYGYVIPKNGGAGSLITIPISDFLGASTVTFQDGYIIAITPNSNQFQISGSASTPIGDATLWDAGNVAVLAGQADYLNGLISWREYLYLFGHRRSQVFYNSGALNFPFVSYSSVFIETGISARHSLHSMTDSLIWIGEDTRGVRACWRMPTFQPMRVSTSAVEQLWQDYPTIADAVAMSYIWKGHSTYQVTFPTAGKTWCYDLTASQVFERPVWYEKQFLDATNTLVARPELYHAYCYGKHLVGSAGADGNPGAIYQYDATSFTDCGTDQDGAQVQRPIVRDRICPHLWQNNKRVIYDRIELELTRGTGLDGSGLGTKPVCMMRWSNDAGNTFGHEYEMAVGQIGQFGLRVFLNRTGYARDRVFWLRCSDPTYWGILGAEIDVRGCAA